MSEQKHWRVGFIGLGKLGLPVATAMAMRGADVLGYDVDSRRMSYAPQPYQEAGPEGVGNFNDYLAACAPDYVQSDIQIKGKLSFGSVDEVVRHADLIFVAVQTPHDVRFEGITPLVEKPVDFDYSYLRSAVIAINEAQARSERGAAHIPVVVVISTVLPGTCERVVKPELTAELSLVYNPSFIAMGTTMRDFLDPEFVLLGADDVWGETRLAEFYSALLPAVPQRTMSIPSAELSKIMYNTALSQKVALANTVMELCHKIPGANCDDVTGAMKASFRRVTGPTYMDGGMGDGGGCHPRDNIAMMWLAEKLKLSHDPFTPAMRGREAQSRWLAGVVLHNLPQDGEVVIMGYAYKPGTNITLGSPALLLARQLEDMGWSVRLWDSNVDPEDARRPLAVRPAVVLLGCRHSDFIGWDGEGLPEGSVVIDPFRITDESVPGVRIVRVGEGLEEYARQTLWNGSHQEAAEARIREIQSSVSVEVQTGSLAPYTIGEGGGHD